MYYIYSYFLGVHSLWRCLLSLIQDKDCWNTPNSSLAKYVRLHPVLFTGIRASVDALCRDGTDMRGDAQNTKSFQTPRM